MRFSAPAVFDTPLWQSATALPPVEVPKVRPKQQGYPGYATGVSTSTSRLVRTDLALANTDILSFRTESDSRKLLAKLTRANPDLAGAANAYIRVGLTQDFKCFARDMGTGALNREATKLAMDLIRRWDLVPNYNEDGFTPSASIRSVAEALGFEILTNGACCAELVLDKARLPSKVVGVPVVNIRFYPDDKSIKPVQVVGGTEVDLDFPTVFYTSVDQSLTTAYANSPLESSIQPVLADTEYLNDLRRVMKRAMHPRLQAILDSEKVAKLVPPEAENDPEALRAFQNQIRSELEAVVNNLSPEDALVAFDMVEFSYISGGTGDVPEVIQTLQELLNAKMATGSKTLPSVLGHGSGSQNIASSETLLFMKTADGIIRSKLNEMFSKILTLAVRLFGLDVAVTFEYDPIQLRPKDELEAFYAMRQSRVLELLSLGLLGDDEASIQLTGQLTPDGFATLSGTRFYQAKTDPNANPYSGTSNGGEGGGAMNQSLKPATPKKAGGRSQ